MPEDLRTQLERLIAFWRVEIRAGAYEGLERLTPDNYVRWRCADELEALLAAGGAPVAEPPGWQPIATAPKDGTRLLCADRLGNVSVYRWYPARPDGIDGWSSDGGRTFYTRLTHWMPLPTPPGAAPVPEAP